MKPMREWKAGEKEPAIFAVTLLLLGFLAACIFGYFNPYVPGTDHYDLDYHNGHKMY